MGTLYDMVWSIATDSTLQKACYECWIDWKRSTPSILGKDIDGVAKLGSICPDIGVTFMAIKSKEPLLELEFKSLACDKDFRGMLHWKWIK